MYSERATTDCSYSRTEQTYPLLTSIFANIFHHSSPFDGIMEGYLTLIDIYIPNKGLVSAGDQLYTKVKASFCAINWNQQASDPSSVPMFNDLKEKSLLCAGTTVTVDLWDVARKATDYDHRNHTFVATDPRDGQGPVPPTAVVFHETRCGSTLIANLLSAWSPQHVRVYSESPPPVAALKACETTRRCDAGAHAQLIRDVFYLMGRVTRIEQPQRVFYKIQSVGTLAISEFARAMPEVPWMFAYRDSVEVMMSHLKNYQGLKNKDKKVKAANRYAPVCLRAYGRAQQHPTLETLVQSKGLTMSDISQEQYCAAHLASLATSAVQEHRNSIAVGNTQTKHWFVNYEQLPHRIWDEILPELGITLKDHMIDRMKEVGQVYSKGRGQKAGETFQEDSTLKHANAPESVKTAALQFMQPVYDEMEAIRKGEE
jgi:hypothetical protein